MKLSKLFGKRQIVLATLIAALSIAIYLNWQFSKYDNDFDITAALSSSKNLGDAQFVNNQSDMSSKTGKEYFDSVRLSRQQTRDHAIEVLKSVATNQDADEAAKAEAIAAVAKIAENITLESDLENLIKAKGFEECVVTVEADKITVAVQTEGLVKSEVMQIRDVVINNSSFKADDLTIIEVK